MTVKREQVCDVKLPALLPGGFVLEKKVELIEGETGKAMLLFL